MIVLQTTLSLTDIILLGGYALACIVIGIWSSRKQKEEDYLIAGRKMGVWAFMASVVASYIGGAAIVAYTAFVYQFGISAIALFLGTAFGFLIFIPYALKIHRYSTKKKFHTLSDYFYFKFDKGSGVLSAIILLVVYFGMLLNQFIAGSTILAGISGWSYETALLISSLIIVLYLAAGGFSSVVKTDIFQYLILIALFLFMLVLFNTTNVEKHMNLFTLERMNPVMTVVFVAFGIFIIFQSAEYWQRVYAARDLHVVRKGLRGSAILVVITGFVLSFVGLIANEQAQDISSANAFASGLEFMLPDQLIGAGLVLIFAAIMTSADTIIFVLASSVAKDYSAHFKHKKQSIHRLMGQTRLFIILFGLLGFAFAWFFRDIIEVFKFITGLGFSIIPAAIGSFHFNLHPTAVKISLTGGILYVAILIITKTLIAEAAVASILIAAFLLFVSQLIIKRSYLKQR